MWRYWEVEDDNGVIVAAGIENSKDSNNEVLEDETLQSDDQKEERCHQTS